MKTRDVWHKNLSNSLNVSRQTQIQDSLQSEATADERSRIKCGTDTSNTDGKVKGRQRANHNARQLPATSTTVEQYPIRSILKSTSQRVNKRSHGRRPFPTKVTLDPNPTVHPFAAESSDDDSSASDSDLELDEDNYNKENSMSGSKKPALKLRLSTGGPAPSNIPAPSPTPRSALRTPSIKLNFKKAGSPETPQVIKLKQPDRNGAVSSGKKRKRQPGEEPEGQRARKQPQPKIKLKTPGTAKTPATPAPIFKLKTKGKVPKRLPGSGYDSELEEREQDPVILEGFIIRMPPGPDCEYVRNAIQNGTIGIHRTQGGADVRMRFLDQAGRRGIIIVNGNQYATTLVDLPCIVEGMKSWDKKGWIKSIDISQMLLVLGLCQTDEEAKDYVLPPDVDPKTYAYAHGLTAPMKWVRKRRFARTRRARVDDIESIERKVNQLLEADAKALGTSFEVLDYDPRSQRDQYSPEYESEDAEAEDDDQDYFGLQTGRTSGLVETPAAVEQPELDEEEVDEYERLFAADIEEPTTNGHSAPTQAQPNSAANGADGSSVAVMSTSASPAPFTSVVGTPAPDQTSDQPQSSEDEESDVDEDSGADDDDKDEDADDNLQQVKDRIADMEAKIAEQTAQLRSQKNAILRKKLAGKIQALKDDVDMMRKQHGLDNDGDGEEDAD